MREKERFPKKTKLTIQYYYIHVIFSVFNGTKGILTHSFNEAIMKIVV